MKVFDMCGVNFQGKFFEPKNISKKAYKTKNMLSEILHTKINGKSNSDLLKNLPFDVFIYCKNPTQKAINPRLSFLIETQETPNQIGLLALKHLNYKDKNNVEKVRDFILNFKQAYEKNRGVPPLSNREKNVKLAELILLGYFNNKSV